MDRIVAASRTASTAELGVTASPEALAPTVPLEGSEKRRALLLFLASFLALYFELIIIRYLATEVRVFAYLKNLPLIGSFFGLGLGMALGRSPKVVKRLFPLITAALFVLTAYAAPLGFTHLPFPMGDYLVWHGFDVAGTPRLLLLLRFPGVVLAFVALIVAFFVMWGGIVGEHLAPFPALRGYGINLAGSLAGIGVYTLLSFFSLPPVFWILLGFLAALPFFIRQRVTILAFSLVALAMAVPQPNTFWSPYYRVSLRRLASPPGWPSPSAYYLSVNHDYHQKIVDLSPSFLARYPDANPNRSAFSTYELPYQMVRNPGQVLIVGAGTGNDVAAALRHGAAHIDAVEIDPVILELGRRHHPERPYQSPRVTAYLEDARAFFKKTRKTYDLIVFGYLDSHTLLSSFSSLRLDNYVYTLESFREARALLHEGGSLVVAFASGSSFITDRLFATLTEAFGVPPRAFFTGYDVAGVVFVAGAAREAASPPDFQEITVELRSPKHAPLLATDRWPFLYLAERTIPISILLVLIPFLYGAVVLLHLTVRLPSLAHRESLHLFLLGAGFLLLETKGVTELALLFGSTWVVNAVVFGAFLVMGLLANMLILFRPVSYRVAYTGLFLLLGLGAIFPYQVLSGLPAGEKTLGAAILAGLPIFFSGLVFSRSFRDVRRPAQALGVNLLGAVVGGALENAVMLVGIPILGVLAILLYAVSAAFLRKPSLNETAVPRLRE